MDYQFKTDVTGQPLAEFEMGHEALGHWLTDELKGRPSTIRQILQAVEKIQAKEAWEFSLVGVEYDLALTATEASIRSHALSVDSPDVKGALTDDDVEDEGELDYYDAEAFAHCGLDDFKAVLLDWADYTGN